MLARFTVTASNAPIDSVYYTLYLDGNVIGGDRVYSIEKDGGKLVSYSFEATEGSHDFMVRLDVDGELEETDSTNNEIRQSFTVEKSGIDNLPIYLAAVAVLLVSSAVLYRYSTRDRKPTVQIKKDPEITEPSVNFPLVLNCLQCGSRVRVARPGSFRCPSCKNVSNVDSNGAVGSGEEKSDRVTTRRPTSTERRLRMEDFLSEKAEEESEEDTSSVAAVPDESELSASEKLRLFREQEVDGAPTDQTEQESEPEPEPSKEKKTRKRKGPPKGGSFGPTVGGF